MATTKTKKPKKKRTNKNVPDNVYDSVFRTIAQHMWYLMIPLINEIFHTTYRMDEKPRQLRNEHYERAGKIITDSIFEIAGRLYHIECQSSKDGMMVLRMIEYDFAIAMEHASMSENGVPVIRFPESSVLYIRNHKDMPKYHEAEVIFPNGQKVSYKVPVICVQDYTIDDMFEKDLLALLPYHVLRYESFLESQSDDPEQTAKFLDDLKKMKEKLADSQFAQDSESFFIDMIDLISKIADHVIPAESPVRKGANEIMKSQTLKLKSEQLKEEGRALELYELVECGAITPEFAADRLKISVPTLQKRMSAWRSAAQQTMHVRNQGKRAATH